MNVRDLPPSERPRERLLKLGAASLSSQELLALVLGKGIRGESVLVTAQKLMSQFGSLDGVLEASIADLKLIRGLGVAKTTQLKACLEIAKRIGIEELDSKIVFKPEDVFRLVKGEIAQLSKEHFVVLSFDVRNRFLGMDTISIGILNANLIHPRETFEAAISRHAAQIILSHNHPSGDCTPSEEDKVVTERLKEAGKLLGIEVIDHIIVSSKNYFSFANEGIL